MNRENIKRVRDHIAGLPPEQVNMGTFLREKSCGTVACIAGWAQQLSGVRDTQRCHFDWLGLTDKHYGLYVPEGWFSDAGLTDEKRRYPKSRVVAVLDHLLETGEVDWSVTEREPA